MIMKLLDHLSLFAIALGIAVMLQPWWLAGFQVGFFLTLAAIVLQVIFSHLR
jgi:hypothetical protein